jgi:uncharacterized protein (TIGR02569 family)
MQQRWWLDRIADEELGERSDAWPDVEKFECSVVHAGRVSTPVPSRRVLAAFGVAGRQADPLSGGRGRAWAVGDLVLKPVDDAAESIWVSDVLADLVEDGFRTERPVRSESGTWVVDGWSAWSSVKGEHDTSSRWSEVIRLGRALNAVLSGLEWPSFLDARTDIWSIGDRTAWGEEPMRVLHEVLRPVAERISGYLTPHHGSSQVIHGDLTGNVLFAPGMPPAVIDFTPYWRPPLFCLAIVAVDAVCWHGAPPDPFETLPGDTDWASLVARAALYRLITSDRAASTQLAVVREGYLRHNAAAHERVLTWLDSMPKQGRSSP